MRDMTKKSRAEILREKKEEELRELRKKESKWRKKQEDEAKCMIGAAFLKHFPDSLMFEAEEWDRIAGAAVMSREFQGTITAIRKEASGTLKEAVVVKKSVSETAGTGNVKETAGIRKTATKTTDSEIRREAVNMEKLDPAAAEPEAGSEEEDYYDEEDKDISAWKQ